MLARIGVALGHHAAERARDRIHLQALVAFDRRQRLSLANGVADLGADAAHDAWKARGDAADAFGIGFDHAIELQCFANHTRSSRRDLQLGRLLGFRGQLDRFAVLAGLGRSGFVLITFGVTFLFVVFLALSMAFGIVVSVALFVLVFFRR